MNMAEKTIMLVCAAGMSTSMLVKKMEEAANNQGLERDIFAVSTSDADDHINNEDIDVLLLGPQVRYKKDEFEQRARGHNVPVEVIPMTDYGTMNGENVINLAEQLMSH
jgi:PTS system cellobiose-specific IIB component